MKTGLKIRGYLHDHPIYDRTGNWNTEVDIGDKLIVCAGGFGSEILVYAKIYTVIDDCGKIKLKSENGDIISEWHTRNTMPFFLKLLNPPP